MTNANKQFSQDEELKDFTDRVINGQIKNTVSDSNDELHGLKETILQLHRNMPSSSLEESTKKQMLVRLNARVRREKEQAQKKFLWASLLDGKWIQNQFRPQIIMTIGITVFLIMAVVISFSVGNSDSSTTVATALNSSSNVFIWIGLATIIIGILWSTRRK